jgi:iron complex transport system substrate-binding protein
MLVLLEEDEMKTTLRKGPWSIVVLLIALALIAAACSSDSSDETTTTAGAATTTTADTGTTTTAASGDTTTTTAASRIFDTGYGEPVEILEVPQATYVWGIQGMENLAVIGVEPVAFSNRFEAVTPWMGVTWPDAVALGQPPAVENLVVLQPDLLISDEGNDVVAITDLAPLLTLRANSYQDTIDQLLLMGQVYGKEAEAEAFVADFDAKLAETQAQIAGETDAPRVMVVYPGVEPGVLGMWLDSSFIGSLLEALGADVALKLDELTDADTAGDNADRATSFGLVQLGLEKVIELDPDAIFVLGSPPEDLIAELEGNAAWNTISAVQNDAVYGFDRDLWSRSRGPLAMSLILEQARYQLYPDVFPPPSS